MSTFYRVVKSDPPTARDFMSNAAKGLPPRGPEVNFPDLHTGISVFDNVDHVRSLLSQTPLRGFIAELVIPDDALVRIAKTLGRGHYTLWGEPATLVGYVKRIV